MEGLIGFLVFLAIAAISGMAKSQKPQRPGSRPQWPGPVAGGPGMPNFPRAPQRPPAPTMPPQRPQPQLQQRVPQGTAPVSPQGSSRYDGEGPAPDENVFTELKSFRQTLDRDIDVGKDVPVEADLNVDRNLRPLELQQMRLDTSLAQEADSVAPEDSDAVGNRSDREAVGLDEMIAVRGNLAQAVIMAEVLGKPKSQRGGVMRRW